MCRLNQLLITTIPLGPIACGPPLTYDQLSILWGSAMADVWADGVFTYEEFMEGNKYNECPEVRPAPGIDDNGVTWSADRFLGIFPNPFHAPLDCYRGTSAELGISSYQCCYDGDVLVEEGPSAGSFDFVYPYFSFFSSFWHYVIDMLGFSQ